MKRLKKHYKLIPIAVLIIGIVIYAAVQLLEKPKTTATWIWDVSQIKGKEEETIEFAKDKNVNLIYLHVSLKKFDEEAYQTFIKEASSENIEVYALGGDPSWGLEDNRKSLDKFADRIKNYNDESRKDQQFKGVHLDIEPYLLPEWERNQQEVVNQWVGNMEYLKDKIKQGTDLHVSGDFPFWLNQVEVAKTHESLGEWMVGHLDSITIMAYRDSTNGKNGIKHLVTPLVETAANQKKSVIIGVNVINTDEGKHTTFYDSSPIKMNRELNDLKKEFKGHPGYGGVAVHDYSHWKKWMKLNS
ncbi:hypothetical protein MUN89_18905 [Halobacillus salinarum]|uniref:Amidase n=1 Tax=Halobacillus salinarum TaxID=2932257 RepID=A0ABY4EHH3_9BACI|nr:hypothetical protein [Halobacillus salinarum]UOQ43914.1 hypothetical protein MUN89_18905 [Halobacillus salinarum]